MEALSGRGWFDAVVRDAHYSARKAFFLPSVCISGAATLIDDARNWAAKIKIFHYYYRDIENQFLSMIIWLRIILNNILLPCSYYQIIKRSI